MKIEANNFFKDRIYSDLQNKLSEAEPWYKQPQPNLKKNVSTSNLVKNKFQKYDFEDQSCRQSDEVRGDRFRRTTYTSPMKTRVPWNESSEPNKTL